MILERLEGLNIVNKLLKSQIIFKGNPLGEECSKWVGSDSLVFDF